MIVLVNKRVIPLIRVDALQASVQRDYSLTQPAFPVRHPHGTFPTLTS